MCPKTETALSKCCLVHVFATLLNVFVNVVGMRRSTCERRPPKELYSLPLEAVNCLAQGQDRRTPSMVEPHPTNRIDPHPALSVVLIRPPPRVNTRTIQFNAPETALPALQVPTGLPQNPPPWTGTPPQRSFNICTCNRWL